MPYFIPSRNIVDMLLALSTENAINLFPLLLIYIIIKTRMLFGSDTSHCFLGMVVEII